MSVSVANRDATGDELILDGEHTVEVLSCVGLAGRARTCRNVSSTHNVLVFVEDVFADFDVSHTETVDEFVCSFNDLCSRGLGKEQHLLWDLRVGVTTCHIVVECMSV